MVSEPFQSHFIYLSLTTKPRWYKFFFIANRFSQRSIFLKIFDTRLTNLTQQCWYDISIFIRSHRAFFLVFFLILKFISVVSEILGVYILELPYKGDEISMFVLLPPFVRYAQDPSSKPQDGIRQLVERLATKRGSEELRKWLDDGMLTQEVELSLPRFEIERELPVGQLLHALGAGELLSPAAADLRGFVADGEQNLHLGDAVHRARIEVTEEGTTAAAATAIFSFRSSRPTEPLVFNADHPFVYLIYDKKSHSILFTGIYRSPGASQISAAV